MGVTGAVGITRGCQGAVGITRGCQGKAADQPPKHSVHEEKVQAHQCAWSQSANTQLNLFHEQRE